MDQSDYFYESDSETKLLIKLYENISSGNITTFADLKKSVEKIPVSNALRKCIFRAFELQRKLYWGFFRDLTPKKYPDIWKQIVIPDKQFRFGGDLKRLMSIPEVYLGLLDIHGYTKFCHEKKRNMSMVDLLDRMIYEDVNAVCAEAGVISKRAQGDEILLLGASADSVLKSVLQIMEYFNTQGRSFKNTVLSKKLPGTVLPKFQISAGIAGGQKFTPLVITRDGDISGDIVNTAARLQAKANRISPDKNRIMITSQVHQKLKSSGRLDSEQVFSSIDFFNIGTVEFKGKSINVFDIIFLPKEEYRLGLRDGMEGLYKSLEKKQWKTAILKSALAAAASAINVQLESGCGDTIAGKKTESGLRESLDLINKTHTLLNGMYFEGAVSSFSMAVDLMNDSACMDRIVMEYLELVRICYLKIKEKYSSELDGEVSLRLNEVCSPQEKENYILLKKHSAMYERLRSSTRLKLQNRRIIWHRISDEVGPELNTVLQSGK